MPLFNRKRQISIVRGIIIVVTDEYTSLKLCKQVMNTMLTETIDLRNQPILTKVGVLSDTHGYLSSRIKTILDGCQVVLHAGDVCGKHVLDELGEISDRVIAVAGNNDARFSYATQRLPDLVHVRLPGGTISLLHGHQFGVRQPSHGEMRASFSDSKAIIYGHTHKQVHDVHSQPWLLNPGAAGDTRTNGGPSCALIAVHDDAWDVSLHTEQNSDYETSATG